MTNRTAIVGLAVAAIAGLAALLGLSLASGRMAGQPAATPPARGLPTELPTGGRDDQPREAAVTRVVDGDTVDCVVHLGMETLRLARVRLEGVNAPERGRPGAAEATAFCESWVREARRPLTLSVSGRDKYGRHVGRIRRAGDDKDLSQALLDAGLARPYPDPDRPRGPDPGEDDDD